MSETCDPVPRRPWVLSEQYGMTLMLSQDNEIILGFNACEKLGYDVCKFIVDSVNARDASQSSPMNKKFYELPLEILQDLGREPTAPMRELLELKRKIELAVISIENGELIPVTEQQRHDHASRYGPGVFVIGDYVIRRRV